VVDGFGGGLAVVLISSSIRARVGLGSSFSRDKSLNNILEGSKRTEDEVPGLGLSADGSDGLDIQTGFDVLVGAGDSLGSGTANILGNGVQGNVIGLLEISQVSGRELSIVEFDNTLSDLSGISLESIIINTVIINTEVFDHGIDGLFENTGLVEAGGVEITDSGVVDGNIGDIVDSSDVLLQFMGEAQQVHVESGVHHDAVSQSQVTGLGLLVDSQVQVGEDNLSLSGTCVDKQVILVDASADEDVTEFSGVLHQVGLDFSDVFLRQGNQISDLFVGQLLSKHGTVVVSHLSVQTFQSFDVLLVETNLEVEMMIVGGDNIFNFFPVGVGGSDS